MKIVIIFAIILQDIQLDANVANAVVLLLVNIMENGVIAIKIANTRQSIQITYVKHQNIVVNMNANIKIVLLRDVSNIVNGFLKKMDNNTQSNQNIYAKIQ